MAKALIVKKEWGLENWLVNTDLYCAKILRVKGGYRCSLHMHPIKDETFKLLKGDLALEVEGEISELMIGETRRIPPRTWHRFSSQFGATVLEVSTHHSDDDVVRREPSGKCS